jgi:arginine decarboxylase
MSEQLRTPLYDAIIKYIDEEPTSFHIPSHKMGAGIDPRWKEFAGDNIFKMDLTEVTGLDDLHQPSGPIKEAQDLAAKAWGAEQSYFLVNGTSSGIIASIATVAKQGEKIIVPRNAHKSVVFGLIISGAIPVYISAEISKEKGLVCGFSPEKLKEIYEKNPDAKGVFSVSPTYHGICSDIGKLVDITHSFGGIFIADEAHGNHVYFNEKLPKGALSLGADISCMSIHKMSGSLGQSSILHLNGNRVDRARLAANLQLTQTTSPSYILMSSLDIARSYIATKGHLIFDNLIGMIDEARRLISEIPCIEVLDNTLIGSYSVFDYEPIRIVISARKLGIQGYELHSILREDYGIEIEFGDYFYGVCVLGLGTTEKDINRLYLALKDIYKRFKGERKPLAWDEELPPTPPQIMSPRQAHFAETEKVAWDQAKGRISADLIVPYPPGIPTICPGEQFTDEVWDFLEKQRRVGRHLHGPEGGSLDYVNVVKQEL